MDNQELELIQNQIGYQFKNGDLLQQAFVRKSYSKENGGENNEVLEFIGDTVLGMAVVKILAEKFGFFSEEYDNYDESCDYNEFCCEYNEGTLTKLKNGLVEKKMLAKRIDDLNIADFLIMGNGDIQNHIEKQESVKEDLFEAIVGAVALDSNWNMDEIKDVVECMLNPDAYLKEENEDNYIELIQEWTLKDNGSFPLYYCEQTSYERTWYSHSNVISQKIDMSEWNRVRYLCLLKISEELPIFRGFGKSKSEARKNVCELAYDYLLKENLLFTIQDEIDNPNRLEAINQLETLARRGYFSIPTYNFKQTYDKNGNPIWRCECHIEEYNNYYSAKSSTKKEAKKTAAYGMLRHVLSDSNEFKYKE